MGRKLKPSALATVTKIPTQRRRGRPYKTLGNAVARSASERDVLVLLRKRIAFALDSDDLQPAASLRWPGSFSSSTPRFVGLTFSKLLVDGLDQLTATAFTTGSGVDQPTGIVTALSGGSSVVNTTTGDTLVSGDVYDLQGSLPPRFQANAQWSANLLTLNALRQFETANGALKFPGLQLMPPTLLGRPANELSNMDGTIDAGQANSILLYGDFQQFVIVDRWPSSLELIPHLFGANRRPTGQRGAFLYARTGSDVVVPNAFRLLVA